MEDFLDGKVESIRNPDGTWINTEVFRVAARHFQKYGYYTAEKWGSPDWFRYWKEERNKCINGVTIGGAKITGSHYSYLNYCPIMKVEDMHSKKSKKIKDFPDFWDGDYNYFWVREIARHGLLDSCYNTEKDKEKKEVILEMDTMAQAIELKALFESLHLEVKIKTDFLNGGYNLIVGKSRRKGYSFKSGSIAATNYFTKPYSLTILNAYDKKYLFPKGLFTMAKSYINFINKHTAWVMPAESINKTDHIKSSYTVKKDGVDIEQGFFSEIMALSANNNSDVNRGSDAYDIFIEESGAFGTPGLLKDLYAASEDCVKAGAIKTGLITIFGTSGDMEKGSVDYADMHGRPQAFDLLPFNNIWDGEHGEHESELCGFFHPIDWNMEGHYDKHGNSDRKSAKELEIKERDKLIENGATGADINKRKQEKPFGPIEAFGSVSINNFPVMRLKRQITKIKNKNLDNLIGTPVNLSYKKDGSISVEPILNEEIIPITSLFNLPVNKQGCVVIYEEPIIGVEKGLYKIGYDPIRQEDGTSLASIIVYKSTHFGSFKNDIIVAEYIGRLDRPVDIDKIAEKLAVLYSTTIMHENEVPAVKNYFQRAGKLHLLAAQPDDVIKTTIKNSNVTRGFGCHMTTGLKEAGLRYILEWLLEVAGFDAEGKEVLNLENIYSVRLLEELIHYKPKGNYDAISALIMVLFQNKQDSMGKVFGEAKKVDVKAKKIVELMRSRNKKH